MPSKEFLKDLFHYRDGKLFYRRSVPQMKAGKMAGCLNIPMRRLVVCIHYKMHYLHRLVWIWHNGPIPPNSEIDHIDHDSLNNRIENLRLTDRRGNARNQSLYSNSKHPRTGITRRKHNGEVSAPASGRGRVYIGRYTSLEHAVKARDEAYAALGFHPNHGRTQSVAAT